MKSLKSELDELEYRREAMIELLSQLLEELEGVPAGRRRTGWHPLDLLQWAVNELVLKAIRAIESTVEFVLDRIKRRRRRG